MSYYIYLDETASLSDAKAVRDWATWYALNADLSTAVHRVQQGEALADVAREEAERHLRAIVDDGSTGVYSDMDDAYADNDDWEDEAPGRVIEIYPIDLAGAIYDFLRRLP